MSNKLGLSIVATVTLLLTGCGGGGGSNTPASNEEESPVQQEPTQTLCQVEGSNVIIGDDDSCEYNNQMLSCSNGRVTMGGMNAETINLNGTQYICESKYNSMVDEERSVEEQKPSDTDTKVGTAESLLNGKVLYAMNEEKLKNREYIGTFFRDNEASIETFNLDSNSFKSRTLYDIVYDGDTITYTSQETGAKKECIVSYDESYTHQYFFNCINDQGESFYEYMAQNVESTKQNPLISDTDRTLYSKDIINGLYAPKINSFSIISNRYIANNRAELDNYYREGEAQINMEFDRNVYGKTMYLFFHQEKAQDIQSTGNHLEITGGYTQTLSLDLIVKDSGLFEYTYNGTSVTISDEEKFSSFPTQGYLDLFICLDKTLSLDTCNYASIPVKLY